MIIMVIDMTTVDVQFLPVSQSVSGFNDVSATGKKSLAIWPLAGSDNPEQE